MRQRRWWAALGGIAGLCLAIGCDASRSAHIELSPLPPPDEYLLGGQTGSLVPDCGVAPLSAGGVAVPVGDAVAVVYASGCPEELAAEQLALTGPGAQPVGLTLETLGDGAFLVRATESLAAGQYELGVAGAASTLSVGDEVAALPTRFGELRFVQEPVECPEQLAFELALGAEASAHVPLMRWLVRVDGGDEQVWVDYGALQVRGVDERLGALSLPRCGTSGCLGAGEHWLAVRGEVAGESIAAAPLQVSFAVACASDLAGVGPAGGEGSGSCALGARPHSPAGSGCLAAGCLAAIVLAARRRRY